jgi:WD40 repeat protein
VTDRVAYDAFVSYSRQDVKLAAAIEQRLEQFPIPKATRDQIGRRRLNVFRDLSDMTGNRLDDSIRRHLADSRKLVVLCSPAARASKYVEMEIDQFVEQHGAEHIVPVLVGGRPNRETAEDATWAFPAALERALDGDPLGADLRPDVERSEAADPAAEWNRLVADVVGLPQLELTGRLQKERVRRLRIGLAVAGAVIVALAGLAVWAIVERRNATEQRDRAQLQADLATSRQLAAAAEDVPAAEADLALALAATAWQLQPTTQAADALFEVLGRNPRLVRYLHGTTGGGTSLVAVAPDEVHAIGAGGDGQLVEWDLRDGSARQLSVEGETPESIAYSPSGATLVVAWSDLATSVVQVWDAAAGTLLAERSVDDADVLAVALLDDETVIVAGGEDVSSNDDPGLLARWHWATDTFVELEAPETIDDVVTVPSGLVISRGGFPDNDEIVLVDATTGAPISDALHLDGISVNDLDVDVDGDLVVASAEERVVLVDAATGGLVNGIDVAPGAFGARFVGDGAQVAVYQSELFSGTPQAQTIRVYSVPSLEATGPTMTFPATVTGLAAPHRSETVLSARDGGGVAMFDVSANRRQLTRRYNDHIANVVLTPIDTAFTPDGAVIVSVGVKSAVARDINTGRVIWEAPVYGDEQRTSTVAVSPDGAVVAVGGGFLVGADGGDVVLLDTSTGREFARHDVPDAQAHALAFSADGNTVGIAVGDFLSLGHVQLLDVASGRSTVVDEAQATSIAFADDRFVWSRQTTLAPSSTDVLSISAEEATAGQPPVITTVDERFGHLVPTGRPSEFAVSHDNQVGILDLSGSAPALDWLGNHRGTVQSLTVDSSGTTLVSTDFSGDLIAWDLERRAAMTGSIALGTANGLQARFSPAPGSSAAVLVSAAGISITDIAPHEWVNDACTIANRELTEDEWNRFVGAERPRETACQPR